MLNKKMFMRDLLREAKFSFNGDLGILQHKYECNLSLYRVLQNSEVISFPEYVYLRSSLEIRYREEIEKHLSKLETFDYLKNWQEEICAELIMQNKGY